MINTRGMTVEQLLSVERRQGGRESPVALAVTPDGRRLLVAQAGADEVSLFGLPSGRLLGRIPTAHYPADVQAASKTLLWIGGKGFGAGPNPNGPNPFSTGENKPPIILEPLCSSPAAPASHVPTGDSSATTRAGQRAGDPGQRQTPAGRHAAAPGGPIKHVFFIVRENRSYDQILGDDAAATAIRS